MTKKKEKLIRLLALIALACLVLFAIAGGRIAGKSMARLDQIRGHLKIIPNGATIGDIRRKYSACLLERYNVHVGEGGSCIIGSRNYEYAEGYNSVSKPTITKIYGSNALNHCLQKAIEQYYADMNISEEEKKI
jgi:hypothetical protein